MHRIRFQFSASATRLLFAIFLTLVLSGSSMVAQSSASRPIGSTGDVISTPGTATSAEAVSAPSPQPGVVSGTVLDVNGGLVPGATVAIETIDSSDRHTAVADANGAFQINGLKPGIVYSITVSANGFQDWNSTSILLQPGQYFIVNDVHLKVVSDSASVTVYASSAQIATEQVRLEEQQHILGFIPNYYVAYDGENAAPLTARLKFQLFMKTATSPVTFAGVAFLAAVDQAGNTPNYQQGIRGYGQRVGAIEADGFSNILIGGALLPSILRQDPRYFYKGTGSTRSRIVHAVSAPFIARGDNGRSQINFSSMGGDLTSSALSLTYYPDSNRGAGFVFGNFALSSGERVVNALAQEFLFSRFTARGK